MMSSMARAAGGTMAATVTEQTGQAPERGARSLRRKNLCEAAQAGEVKGRVAQLRPDSERLWGKMKPAQMLAHCSAAIGMAVGETRPPRILLGRLLGRMAKKSLITNGTPMRRNSMTDKSVLVTDERDFAAERQRLPESIDRFRERGAAIWTRQRQFFLLPLAPVGRAVLMYH